jgi:serine/threonine-protein kinase
MSSPASEPSGGPAFSTPTPAAEDLSGRTLGEFTLVRRLGQGGMGQVYLAEQRSLKRHVAVKLLKAELAAQASSLARFRQEAEAVACLNHANIVQVHTIGESDGLPYMVMEYVEGRNLRDYLARKGPPELPVALSIMRQVASALQRAAEGGFVHRDIKPDNILLTRKGEVKVADFGLSRSLTGDQPLHLTQSGVTLGTPLYMSPEQVQGQPVDHRSDIYSFGVTCYHMLTGRPPFQGSHAFEVALQHVQGTPIPLTEARPDLPASLGQLVQRMMAKSPDDRPQNGREILRELAKLRDRVGEPAGDDVLEITTSIARDVPAVHSTIPPRRSRHWLGFVGAAGLFAVVALSGAAVRLWQGGPRETLVVSNDVPPPAKLPTRTDPKEQRLLEAIDTASERGNAKRPVPGMIERLQLGAHYLDRSKDDPAALAKAEAFFREQRQSKEIPHQMLGRLGLAVVLSYRDKAEESVRAFQEILSHRDEKLKQRFGMALFLSHPDFGFHLREAIERDRVNLEPQPLPQELDNLVRLRPRPFKLPG